ncbi:hypothetical protein F7Q99_26370 [Streptomyces kaniharaensis]|uniref:Uncharacterized protein n=1 Tax=Streptomyces kaniharaensis TaxID=212423 RepID=A0A6N7KZL2_9ACTN|nr:hypothetical protein [Streptomyces kaniharaensis]MQS15698.1 hypothetical protein [Streptomyces kaniharaensis]
MVTAARGARYTPKQFEELWRGLVECAPFHYEGHLQGLQYWCAKWFGSDKKMLAFAKRAMKKAPAGSPLPGLHLHALHELELRGALGTTLAGELGKQPVRKVAAALAQVRPDDERLPMLRHLLAHYAGTAGLYGIALEQFRAIGPWCGCTPWTGAADPATRTSSTVNERSVERWRRAGARARRSREAQQLLVAPPLNRPHPARERAVDVRRGVRAPRLTCGREFTDGLLSSLPGAGVTPSTPAPSEVSACQR